MTHLSERSKNHAKVQGRDSFNVTLRDEGNIGTINHK